MQDIKKHAKQIDELIWEIPTSYREDMRVPARIFATEEMLDDMLNDRTIGQIVNVTTLPGIHEAALVMPDGHEGYGFPIGGVAATEYPDGVISPGGIGYDINCGVRLLKTELDFQEVEPHLESLSRGIYHEVPSGVGQGGTLKLSNEEVDDVLKNGVEWMIQNGHGENDDKKYIESNGKFENADPSKVSAAAKKRGRDQLGTMGAGNHFVEVDKVDEILDPQAADAMGLRKDQVVILIHTGSRGLGHQIATDYIKKMGSAMEKHNIELPDRELACAPFSSKEGSDYFDAMACGANFAWSNRQYITEEVRRAWQKEFGQSGGKVSIVYDVAHNLAKIEEYNGKKLIVHRKGATRAFGPNHEELVDEYKSIGQPVLIPGSMGTASYVLAGTEKSYEKSFGSSCHGAGRRLSRKAAKKEVEATKLIKDLKEKGIWIRSGSMSGVAEEAPIAYKDVDNVVDVVHRTGIAKKVARLKPLATMKG